MNRVGCLGCGCDERSAVDVAALAQARSPNFRSGRLAASQLTIHAPGMTAGLAYTPNMVYIFKIKIKNVN